MTIGDTNPLPFVLGDEPSPTEQTYNALKSMVGAGGSSTDTVEDDWRWAKARALGTLSTFDERGALQAFPQTAYDFVGVNEKLLALKPRAGDTVYSRALRVFEKYRQRPETYSRALELAVQSIEPSASLLYRGFEHAVVTQAGKPYADGIHPHVEGKDHTALPALSDEFEVTVLVPMESGAEPSVELTRRITAINSLLADVLSSWVDFQVITETEFTLDLSLLDYACPGSIPVEPALIELRNTDLSAVGTPMAGNDTWLAHAGPNWDGDMVNGQVVTSTLAGGKALCQADGLAYAYVTLNDNVDRDVLRAVWTQGQDRTLAWVVQFGDPSAFSWGSAVGSYAWPAEGAGAECQWFLFVRGPWMGNAGFITLGTGWVTGAKVDTPFQLTTAGEKGLLVMQVRGVDEMVRVRWKGVWSGWMTPPWATTFKPGAWFPLFVWVPAGSGTWMGWHGAWNTMVDDATLDAKAGEYGVT